MAENRYKDIQLPQLRSFCIAASERNFTTAARSLGLSAPTVWQQVRALERRLKTSLLRRQGRHVELTADGQLLLDLVHPHVSGLDSLESLFQARQAEVHQALTVAAIPYLTSCHLLEPIRAFSHARPQVQLKLHVLVWFEDVLRMVEQGQADLGVMFFDRDGPRHLRIDYERLFDLQFSVLLPKDHPLARKRKLEPADLAPYPWIVPPAGSYARRTIDQLLQRHNLANQVNIVMETPLLEIIRKYVSAGIGIGLVHVGGEAEPAAGVLTRPLEAHDSISVGLVSRKGAHHSEAVREFQAVVRRHLGQSVGGS